MEIAQTFTDDARKCVDCGMAFVWTAGQQEFFHDRQLSPPKRCEGCRAARRRSARLVDGPPRSRDWRQDEQR